MAVEPPTGSNLDEALAKRCRGIELLAVDVDGVMTDGSIVIDDHGVESKRFHVRDGAGLTLWRRAGKQTAIISGRSAAAVDRRAAELGIEHVFQGVRDKSPPFRTLLDRLKLAPDRVCYVGDDLADLAIFQIPTLGLAACPADAVSEIRGRADLITSCAGGRGVIRELVETILKAQGRWSRLIDGYFSAIG